MLKKLQPLCAAAVLTAGCGAPAALPGVPAGADDRAARAGSWMAPDAKAIDLLYVSDYARDDVYAYSYPQGKLRGVLRGVLAGFPLPTALCSDRNGDVFIPDSADSAVLEYAHGSTRRLRILSDRDAMPYSCEVDPRTGNLAVENIESLSGPGDVAVYAHARGLPKRYNYGFVYKYFFGAYDDGGNLFVDAADNVPSEPFAFLELPKGGRTLEPLTLDRTIGVAGGVGWDGKYVTVGDVKASTIYRFAIAGSSGTEEGATPLRRAHFVAQYLFANGEVVGAEYRGASVAFWRYPRGGAPARTMPGFGEPFGVTLSNAPK